MEFIQIRGKLEKKVACSHFEHHIKDIEGNGLRETVYIIRNADLDPKTTFDQAIFETERTKSFRGYLI